MFLMSSTIRIVSCCIVHCMQIHVTETKISKNIYPNCAYYNLVFSILFHLRKDFGCNLLNLFYSPLVDCAYELEKPGMECCRRSLGDSCSVFPLPYEDLGCMQPSCLPVLLPGASPRSWSSHLRFFLFSI